MKDFPGKIGRTVADSTPWWPAATEQGELPPNIVTIMFDDTGWSDFGCFGSEIRTPSIDALANEGLRYTNFHVTPLCSPTRACFLSGRNHHSVGMRNLADTDTGFPSGRGAIHRDIPLLPEMLRDGGYGTYMVGKWHLTPAHEVTPAGPYANWPANRGFDRYYGFLGGCTDHYAPELVQDNHSIDPPLKPGYHLSEDLAERAIAYLRDHAAFRRTAPFFLNFCFGATHAPIQVERRYIDPYVPVFEKGWDRTRADRLARQKELGLVPGNTELVPLDADIPAWDTIGADEKRLYTHLQAAFAGFLEHADEQIGRVVAELKRLSLYDNTIIMVMSDNGASREGGPHGAVDVNAPYSGAPETVAEMIGRIEDIGGPRGPAHYPQGWAVAGNTPFRRYKQYVELGGVRSPLVVNWPMGIQKQGEVRDQFLHVIDLAPTIMDLVGNRRGGNFDGSSFRLTMDNAGAPAPRNTQHWEMFGRRAIYCEGWKAVSEHEKGDDYASDIWRLYDTRTDFSECHDLSAERPDKLKQLQDIWWQEAEANDVMPLDDRTLVDIIVFRQPNGVMGQREVTLYAGQGHVPQLSMITSTERSMEITAHFTEGWNGEEGVLVSAGDSLGGYTLYIRAGKFVFEHVHFGKRCEVEGVMRKGAKRCSLILQVSEDRSARAKLFADRACIGAGEVAQVSSHLSFWGLDVGRDAGIPVSDVYDAPFDFPGRALDRIVMRFFEDVEISDLAAIVEAAE
jgi:arylsulfatase